MFHIYSTGTQIFTSIKQMILFLLENKPYILYMVFYKEVTGSVTDVLLHYKRGVYHSYKKSKWIKKKYFKHYWIFMYLNKTHKNMKLVQKKI